MIGLRRTGIVGGLIIRKLFAAVISSSALWSTLSAVIETSSRMYNCFTTVISVSKTAVCHIWDLHPIIKKSRVCQPTRFIFFQPELVFFFPLFFLPKTS